jgi:nucleoside-diphosphate-sugar epimerase
LIAGSGGQIGTSLAPMLIKRYGVENVILSDITYKKPQNPQSVFERLDVTDINHYRYLIQRHEVNYILHLSGILSAVGEKNPELAIKININGVTNALDMAKEFGVKYI